MVYAGVQGKAGIWKMGNCKMCYKVHCFFWLRWETTEMEIQNLCKYGRVDGWLSPGSEKLWICIPVADARRDNTFILFVYTYSKQTLIVWHNLQSKIFNNHRAYFSVFSLDLFINSWLITPKQGSLMFENGSKLLNDSNKMVHRESLSLHKIFRVGHGNHLLCSAK